MNSIQSILERLGPILEVNIGTSRNTNIFPLQDAQYKMQMAFYWLKSAMHELLNPPEGGEFIDQAVPKERSGIIKPPTLLGVNDKLNYMSDQLTQLSIELKSYLTTNNLPTEVLYKSERGYDGLVEAFFSTEIAKAHYQLMQDNERRNS